MTVGEAADVMLTYGFRHLHVVEGRDLKGVVSIRDVLASGIRRRSNFEWILVRRRGPEARWSAVRPHWFVRRGRPEQCQDGDSQPG
jgi:hypothetical protein